MPGLRARLFATLLLAGLAVGPVGVGAAQDTVEVRVTVTGAGGQPSDATVTLTPQEGGAVRTCRTSGGRCRLAAVPHGRYVVTATAAADGSPPLPRVVWVPPRVPSVAISVRLR